MVGLSFWFHFGVIDSTGRNWACFPLPCRLADYDDDVKSWGQSQICSEGPAVGAQNFAREQGERLFDSNVSRFGGSAWLVYLQTFWVSWHPPCRRLNLSMFDWNTDRGVQGLMLIPGVVSYPSEELSDFPKSEENISWGFLTWFVNGPFWYSSKRRHVAAGPKKGHHVFDHTLWPLSHGSSK